MRNVLDIKMHTTPTQPLEYYSLMQSSLSSFMQLRLKPAAVHISLSRYRFMSFDHHSGHMALWYSLMLADKTFLRLMLFEQFGRFSSADAVKSIRLFVRVSLCCALYRLPH